MPARATLINRPPVHLLRTTGKRKQRVIHGTAVVAGLRHRVKRLLFQIRPERPGFHGSGRLETTVTDDVFRTRGLAKDQEFMSGAAGKFGLYKFVSYVL